MSQSDNKPEDQGYPKIGYRYRKLGGHLCKVDTISENGRVRDMVWDDYYEFDGPRLRPGIAEAWIASGRSSSDAPYGVMMRIKELLKDGKDEVKYPRPQLSKSGEGPVEGSKVKESATSPSRNTRGPSELNMRRALRDGAARHSRLRRSKHRQGSQSIYPERYYYRPPDRPATVYESAGLQPPPLGTFIPVKHRPSPQGSIKDGRPHCTCCVSMTSDRESRPDHPSNQAETHSISVPSDVKLDIRIAHEDSSEKPHTMEDPCATSLQPPSDYVLANEEDYLAKDDSEGYSTSASEPLAGYALANEEDYLAKDNSNCEDDV